MDGWMDERGRGPPPRCKSVRERKLGSITGLRSTPGYQTSLLYRVVDPRKSWRGSNRYPRRKQRPRTDHGPISSGQFAIFHFARCPALRNPVSPSNDSPGATQGENVSVYPDRREISQRVWSGSQRDDVNVGVSVYLSIGNIAPLHCRFSLDARL